MDAFAYLPGLDGSAELLFMQEERLAERYRILRVPWRTDATAGLDDLVDDVIRTLDDAGVERATICAESFGGTVGLRTALEHSDRVERLVLCNAFAYYPNRALIRWGRRLAQHAHPDVVHLLRQLVDTPLLAFEGVPAHARRRFIEATYRQPLSAYVRRLDFIDAFDVRERLGELEVPTLVVAAEHDRVVACVASRELAAAIPGAKLRIVPGRGHALLMTPGVSLVELLEDAWPSSRPTELGASELRVWSEG